MFPKENLYQILEIEVNSSLKDIKNAFKRQIRKFHPDKHVST